MVAVDLTIIGVDLARMEVEMAAEDLTAALWIYVDVAIVDVVAAAVTCVDFVMLQLVLGGNGSSRRYKQPQPANVITPFPSNNWFSDISRVLSLQHFKYRKFCNFIPWNACNTDFRASLQDIILRIASSLIRPSFLKSSLISFFGIVFIMCLRTTTVRVLDLPLQ